MIQLNQIRNYFPATIRDNAAFGKHMIKEYLQLAILDFLSTTPYVRKTTFIGGTNLRLVKGIDRFSEDLDFDCKDFSKDEFSEMTDAVVRFLRRSGWQVETRDRDNPLYFNIARFGLHRNSAVCLWKFVKNFAAFLVTPLSPRPADVLSSRHS